MRCRGGWRRFTRLPGGTHKLLENFTREELLAFEAAVPAIRDAFAAQEKLRAGLEQRDEQREHVCR